MWEVRLFKRNCELYERHYARIDVCYLSYNFYCSRFAQARNYDLGFEPQKQNGQTELATLSAI